MPAYRLTLWNDERRKQAKELIDKAPAGYRVDFSEPKRTDDQNSHLWAALADVAMQAKWHGRKLTSEDWKLIFMSGLNHELRVVPNFNGDGFIPLGFSSSRLSKADFSQLIDLIYAWGAQNGVQFKERETA